MTTSVFDAELPTIDYLRLTDPDAAHRILSDAVARTPIAMGMYGPEILSYELAHNALRDRRFATARGLGLDVQGVTSGPVWDRAVHLILGIDGEPHSRLRRLVSQAFSPRAAKRTHALIDATITRLLDSVMEARQCDVVADIALSYPTAIICAMLGVPQQDHQLFSDWSDAILKLFDGNIVEDEPAIAMAWDELDAYLEVLLETRRENLGDDVVSDLIRAEDEGDRLSHEELLMLASSLLVAGTDTTRNQLAASVQALCSHPDQWTLLAEHPELTPQAVEELMRYYPITHGAMRRTAVDVELGGVTIPAETVVFINTGAANRDPSVFPEPEKLDIMRQHPRAILTFGGGMHYCLGVHLARLELTVALRAITQRMAHPHLTGHVPWKSIAGVSGPLSVPIEFEAVY